MVVRPEMRSASKLTVDRLEFSGVTVFSVTQIEPSLEIGVGDRYEPTQVLRTAANLKKLYRAHGYEQVKIQAQFLRKKEKESFEDVLEFKIEEGDPTRVAEVLIVSEGSVNSVVQRDWYTRVGLRQGDLLDEERLSAGKRNLQDLLASREYVGAQAETVRIETAGIPSGMETLKTNRWVKVEFRIRLGDRVSFGFRGNSVFNFTELLALVEDQRVLGLGKDYVISIKNRIEQEYRALGYAQIKVTPYTFEKPAQQERHVSYEIQEGPRVLLDHVEFDGNKTFSEADLQREFYAKASSVIRQGYYSEVDAKNAADLVIEWLKSKGYLSAKLVAMKATPFVNRIGGQLKNAVTLTLYVYEWDQTLVRTIELKGANAVTSEEIKATLGIREGEPLNLSAFSQGIEALKALYRSKGYLGMSIANEEQSDQVINYLEDNRIADVFLEIVEGPRYRVSKIILEGLTFTHETVVTRELPIHEGEILEEFRVTETEARLRKLGIFSSVTLKVTDDPEKEGYKILRILFQEGTPGVINGGIGFRNDLGIRVFSGIAYTNLWGNNHTLAFDVNANRRVDSNYHFGEFQTQLAYVWPWFLNREMTFRPNFTVSRLQYRLFDATSVSAAAVLEKRLLSHLTGSVSYTLERVNQFNATVYQQDNQGVTIGAITPTLRLDYRDHPLSPTRGFYGMASFEYAAPWLLSQLEGYPVSFTRFQLRTDSFIPVTSDVIWYCSFRMGIARNLESVQVDPVTGQVIPFSGAIPTIKRFALGGAGSLRGFTEQQLNHQTGSIHGMQSYINYRTQIDLPISGNLKIGPFLDAANLQVDTFSLGNLRFGAGVGIHYQTPVGPVNMDLGFNLNPGIDRSTGRPEPSSVFYFTIGVI